MFRRVTFSWSRKVNFFCAVLRALYYSLGTCFHSCTFLNRLKDLSPFIGVVGCEVTRLLEVANWTLTDSTKWVLHVCFHDTDIFAKAAAWFYWKSERKHKKGYWAFESWFHLDVKSIIVTLNLLEFTTRF